MVYGMIADECITSINLVVLSYVDEQDFVAFDDELEHDPVADIYGD